MKYNNYDITKIYYSGYTVTAAYGCGGYQVYSANTEPTNYKLYFTDNSGNTGTVQCNSNINLTSGETINAVPSPGCIMRAKVGDCVENIANGAFYNFACLYDIKLPDTLVEIDNYAFYYAHSITSITIPDSVTTIGDYAFQNTYNRDMSVKFSTGLTYLGISAFEDSGISGVTLYDGLEEIKQRTFYDCYDLKQVTLPSTITTIGTSAFTNCERLESFTIQAAKPPTMAAPALANTNDCPIYVMSDVVDLYKAKSGWSTYASRIRGYDVHKKFKGWYNNYTTINIVLCNSDSTLTSGETKPSVYMTSAEIGDCVTTLAPQVFYTCNSLTSVTIPNSVTSIGQYAFNACSSLPSINIPDNVTTIGDSAFRNCSGLTSVNISSGVTSINDNLFYCCSGLTSVNIPSGTTSVGKNVFYRCLSLTNLDIPSGVTSIGSGAFKECTALENFTIHATTPPTLGINAFYGTDTSKLKIYVPSGSVNAYKAANNWSTYASLIQAMPT